MLNGDCLRRNGRLRNSSEFRTVYESGRRYDGQLMTVFVVPNKQESHRLGITSSRKVARRAVARNRSKRLLRETFRQSNLMLDKLAIKYDWVLNAKRALLCVKLASPQEEFEAIISRVAGDEIYLKR